MNIHLPAILRFTRYQGFDPSLFLHRCQVHVFNPVIGGYDKLAIAFGYTPIKERDMCSSNPSQPIVMLPEDSE